MDKSFYLDVTYTIGNKKYERWVGTHGESLDEVIEQQKMQLLSDYPNAKNINVCEEKPRHNEPLLIDELVKRIKSERPDLSDEHLAGCEFMLLTDPRPERNVYMPSFWRNLPDAKKVIEDDTIEYNDWVYIRRWGIVLFNVGQHTSHEIFMANWNWILSNLFDGSTLDLDDLPSLTDCDAEAFLHNQHGFFVSRVGTGVTKSTNMKLNASERLAFAAVRFRELEPD